jgi:RNA polymerase sigma-70 factor (ECF subfamily)
MENTAAGMWQQIHGALTGFIRKRVSNEAETDDILQEVFLRVHKHIGELRDPDRLISWMYKVTRHVIIDYYRSAGRRREVPVGLATSLEGDAAGSHAGLEPDVKMELFECLRPMIDRLSEEYREAIRLVELEGLTHQQAAKQLGLSVPGMKSRVQRGRQQLRKLFHACCVIELDSRGGVTEYEARKPGPGC